MEELLGSTYKIKRGGAKTAFEPTDKVGLFNLSSNFRIFDNFNTVSFKAFFLLLHTKSSPDNKKEVYAILEKLKIPGSGVVDGLQIAEKYEFFLSRADELGIKHIYYELSHLVLQGDETFTNFIELSKLFRVFYKIEYSDLGFIVDKDVINNIENYGK